MTKDSGNIFYNVGTYEHFIKIASSSLGVDVCNVADNGNQYWSFIPWCSIRKIEYVVEG